MTEEERDFTHLRLLSLGAFLHAAKIERSLTFPVVKDRLDALVSRLADASAQVDFIEVSAFLDCAEAEIAPSLRDTPEHQAILLESLNAAAGGNDLVN